MRTKQSEDSVDRLVGQRVYLLRKAAGLSQMQLGGAIGVSFQQVQKYEKGTNRISASRLFAITKILGVTVADLFADVANAADQEIDTDRQNLELTTIDIKIAAALSRVRDAKIKRRIYELVAAVARETERTPE